MTKSWIKCEDGDWINLEHTYWAYVLLSPDQEGFWEVCVSFMKNDTPVKVVGSYKTEVIAHSRLDDIMMCLALRKN